MTDRYLLEAMREVDELTPACPPIAPPRDSFLKRFMTCEPGALIEVDLPMREIVRQTASLREYEGLANRSMTDEEYRGMRNAYATADMTRGDS